MNKSQIVKSFNWWGLIPLILVVWVYGAVVRLPLFSDDVIHFRGTNQTSAHEILTQVQIGAYYLRYYRPVVNLILYAQWQLGIEPSAALWHGMILFNHLLNMVLVGLLFRRLGLSRTVQITGMLVFGIFPFSFQVVVWVLAWFHALVLTALLISCIAALYFFEHPRRIGWLLVAWLAGCIAPFIHENGVLAAVWVSLFLIYRHRQTVLHWKFLLILLPILGAAFGYLYIWSSIGEINLLGKVVALSRAYLPILSIFPMTLGGILVNQKRISHVYREVEIPKMSMKWVWLAGGLLIVGLLAWNLRGTGLWTALHPKAAYFVQGISFPIQMVAGRFSTSEAGAAIGGLAFGMGIAGLGWSSWDRRFQETLILAWVWFGLAILPAILWLNIGYITNSPRLFYVSSPAIALCYGLLLDYGFRKSILWRGITLAVLGLVVLGSIVYVRDRQELHLTLGDAYHDLLSELPADTQQPILIVNAPRWLASEGQFFPLDKLGAVFVPDYFPFEDFLWLNSGREYAQVTAVTHLETLYWQQRTTGIGQPVLGMEAVPQEFRYAYIFVAEQNSLTVHQLP